MNINVLFEEREEILDLEFGQVLTGASDYRNLTNKPSINSIVLEGALSAEDLGLGRVYYDTTANWNLNPGLISEKGAVYIYSDHEFVEDEGGNRTPVAGLRIGDGNSYLIDLPFVNSATVAMIVHHVANQTIHVSKAEKEFWDNKVSAYQDPQDPEALVLSKTHYELNGEIRSKE